MIDGEGAAVWARMRRGFGDGDFLIGFNFRCPDEGVTMPDLVSTSELRASRMLAGISVRIELIRASSASLFVGLVVALRVGVDVASVAVFLRMIFTGVVLGLRSVTSSNR